MTMNCIKVEQQGNDDSDGANKVNASACEFLEVILKQVTGYPIIANKIAHLIVKPLIQTFYYCINRKKEAMQVNLINLLS